MGGVGRELAPSEERTYLSFCPKGNGTKLAFWLAMIGFCIYMVQVEPPASHSSKRGLFSLFINAFGPDALVFLIGVFALIVSIKASVDTWRFFAVQRAISLSGSGIEIHKSFLSAPRQIPFNQIRVVAVARADRLQVDIGQRAVSTLFGKNIYTKQLGWGARFRSGLKIEYYDLRGRVRRMMIWDNTVKGGYSSLVSFHRALSKKIPHNGQ